MKNWNLQGIVCFSGLLIWISRLWLMVEVWWKFKTFTLFSSLPTSVKVNCYCCIFSRDLGWERGRVNFLLNIGARSCLDSRPVIRSMRSGVRVLAFTGDQLVSLARLWLEVLLVSGANHPRPKHAQVQGWEPAEIAKLWLMLLEVQAVSWDWTRVTRYVGERKQHF